jgi:hypothetical protein
MSINIASSSKDTVKEAVEELKGQLGGVNAKLVIFFASTKYDPAAISAQMQASFAGVEVIGCSTAGEIVSGQMLKNAVVAMALDGAAVQDVKVEVVEHLQEQVNVDPAFSAFEKHFGEPVNAMDHGKYVGIVLVDGLSGAEERLIDKVGDLTNVTFIGGSAGDDLKFQATHVYANGRSYSNAALLALLKPGTPFTFIKTQSFCDLGKKLVVTRANEAQREVLEFNGKPAAAAYAEALGTSVSDAPERFMHNPVGLVIEGEPYVRSPQQIKGEKMAFYCGVTEGMELSVLESTNIIDDTAQALAKAKAELGAISGIINFNCILRTLELDSKQLSGEYAALFAQVPTIGFSTYGEQYIGHINQTATMLVLK